MDAKAESQKWAILREQMRELLHSPSWDAYMIELEAEEQRMMKTLVACSKDEHDYLKGYIMGLRFAAYRPEKIIKTQGG